MNASLFIHQAAVSEEASQVECYRAMLPAFEALDAASLITVNVDIPTAITTAMGALSLMQTYRPALAKLDGFDIARFDELETRTKALAHAHSLYLTATQPSNELRALQEEGTKLRDWLHKDVSVAVSRGVIPAQAIDDLRGANGYKNTATDLQILVSALQANWDKMKGRCATTEAELEYAQKLAFHMLRTVGERRHGQLSVSDASDKRARAFTLLFQAYNDARQGIAFVRRVEGDVDRIAPHLYTGRPAPKKKESGELTPSAPAVDDGPLVSSPLLPPAGTAQLSPTTEVIDPYGA